MFQRTLLSMTTGRKTMVFLPFTAVAILLLAFIFIFPSPLRAEEVVVAGRVFTQNGPLAGAVVSAYARYTDIRTQNPVQVSPPSDTDGVFRMTLPPGHYYFTAQGTFQDTRYTVFHGHNPILLATTNVWLPLMANPYSEPRYQKGETGISGQVTYKGKPLNDAYISAYLPTDTTFKGLGFKTQTVNPDGTFFLSLPVGEYVVVAKRMVDGSRLRPLQRGDLIGYFPANPVAVKHDMTAYVEVPCYPKGDRSTFVDVPEIKDNTYQTVDTLLASLGKGIRGRVTDVDNKPLAGVYVLAYKTEEEVFQMYQLGHGTQHNAVTDDKGDYFIPLTESGRYYVVARDTIGDGPHRGEIYGLYQGTADHTVAFAQGNTVTDINIVAGTTMGSPTAADQREILAQPILSPGNASLFIEDNLIIDQDTVWSGTVTITGVVSVKRGATLTVAPGTVVRFTWRDLDENNIGDSEILVEGRIIARGTETNRIVFTSAEAEPKPLDWSYINVLATENTSLFEHCDFHYGFSGMQIHYSNVEIRNSRFSKNGEGLHFNTANVLAEHNLFTDNGVGIKFSRMEGKVLIQRNEITGNRIGIQFTHQHINAVNFDNLHMVREPPVFVGNTIQKNERYNFVMGDRQKLDLPMPGNWWGSKEKEEIGQQIFDKVDDDELGQVFFMPALSAPHSLVGMQKEKIEP